MTKRTINLFAFLLLLVTTLYAQEDFGFDISKYQTPDISRKGLSFEIKTNNEFQNYSSLSDGISLQKKSDYTGNNNLNGSFWIYENTRKKISMFSIGVDTDLSIRGYDDIANSTNSSLSYSNFYLPIVWENKLFLQPKLFFSYNLEASSLLSKHKETELKQTTYNLTNNFFDVVPSIGVGIGRIENVTDARQALYILEALKENNVLSDNIDATKIDEFAKVISTVKNKRFLDARLHKIEELTAVDEFLKENNLLTSPDISYFTALNDMWEYGDLFERKSGYELSLRNIIGNEWLRNEKYEKSQFGYVEDFYTTDYYFTNKIVLGFDFSKPIKLNWQHDFTSNLTANFIRENSYNSMSDVKTENKPPMVLSANAEYKLGYYPNTRTNIYLRGVAGYLPSAYKSETENRIDSQLYFGANLGTYYYFSPNLRLSADAYIGNNTYLHLDKIADNKIIGNSFPSGFDVTLTYSFF